MINNDLANAIKQETDMANMTLCSEEYVEVTNPVMRVQPDITETHHPIPHITVIDQIKKLPVKTLAPGHGELGDLSTIKTQQRYFVELRKEIAGLIKKGRTLEEIKKEVKISWYKKWTGVDVLEREENIEHVFGELSQRNQ